MMKTIIAIAVVIVLGGGYWYWTTMPASAPVVEQGDTSGNPAGTQLEGSDQIVDAADVPVAPAAKTYTLTDVATHNGRASCWSAINGAVYDLTTWIDKHPGGAQRILSICGKDGSSAFTNQHEGEPKPEAMLASFKLGTLAQ